MKRRPRLYRLQRSGLDSLKLFVLVGMIIVGVAGLTHFFANSSAFRLSEVNLSGNYTHLGKETILAAAKIPFGENLFGVNLYPVGQNIKHLPWVRDVTVRRSFPHAISIWVDEYIPRAILMAVDKSLMGRPEMTSVNFRDNSWMAHVTGADFYYMNAEGVLFKKLNEHDNFNYPVITGFLKEKLIRFPGYYRMKLKDVVTFLTSFSESPSDYALYALHDEPTEGMQAALVPADLPCKAPSCRPVEVAFGRGNYAEKISLWARFISAVKSENAFFRSVNLSVPGKIFVRN